MTSPDLLRELRKVYATSESREAALLAVYERGRRDGATQQRDAQAAELTVLATHSGETSRREWPGAYGSWLYPGEAIYEGKLLTTLVTDADPPKEPK